MLLIGIEERQSHGSSEIVNCISVISHSSFGIKLFSAGIPEPSVDRFGGSDWTPKA